MSYGANGSEEIDPVYIWNPKIVRQLQALVVIAALMIAVPVGLVIFLLVR